MPFLGGKTGFFLAEAKTRKNNNPKKNKKQKKIKNKQNKEGLGPFNLYLDQFLTYKIC